MNEINTGLHIIISIIKNDEVKQFMTFEDASFIPRVGEGFEYISEDENEISFKGRVIAVTNLLEKRVWKDYAKHKYIQWANVVLQLANCSDCNENHKNIFKNLFGE